MKADHAIARKLRGDKVVDVRLDPILDTIVRLEESVCMFNGHRPGKRGGQGCLLDMSYAHRTVRSLGECAIRPNGCACLLKEVVEPIVIRNIAIGRTGQANPGIQLPLFAICKNIKAPVQLSEEAYVVCANLDGDRAAFASEPGSIEDTPERADTPMMRDRVHR
jgi:hypothetical protein